MRSRRNPARLAELLVVQRMRRLAAEAALGAARDAARRATADRDVAMDRLDAAQAHWVSHVTAAGFAPERARALAGAVVASETRAIEAEGRLGECRDTMDRCDRAWRTAEAQVRAVAREHAGAVRDAGRRRDERRLAESDDRTIRNWSSQCR